MTELGFPKCLEVPPPDLSPYDWLSKVPNFVPPPRYEERWQPNTEGKKYYSDLEKEKKANKEEFTEKDILAFSLLFRSNPDIISMTHQELQETTRKDLEEIRRRKAKEIKKIKFVYFYSS